MRSLKCVSILAFALFLNHIYCETSSTNSSPSPIANSPPTSPPIIKASPFETAATILTGTKLDEVTPLVNPPTKVKSYLLVLQWPAGVCSGKSGIICKQPMLVKDFVIHGLWPQFSLTDPPSKSSEEIGGQIVVLLTKLRNKWPTLKDKEQDIAFWSYQWHEHGIYSEMGVAAYFTKALELFDIVGPSLLKGLDAEGIKPNGTTYSRRDVEIALKNVTGFKCRVICVQSKMDANVELIQEIRISYTTDFELQDNLGKSKCKAGVRFSF